jgi:hypothetical protein
MAELQYISKSGHLVISKNGNVGIGIVDPSSKLQINGLTIATEFTGSSATPLSFTNLGTGTYNKAVMYNTINDGFTFEAPWETNATTTRVPFILTWRGGMGYGGIKLNGDTQIHTDNDGVGIDITDPNAKLHVGGTSIFDGLMTINDGNNYAKLGDLNSNSTMALEMKDGADPIQIEAYSSDMRFYTGGGHRLTILSTGNTRVESANKIEFLNSNQYIYSPDGSDLRLGAADDIYLQSSYIRFWSGATEYARIAINGSWIDDDLNIGSNSAQGDYKLKINGTTHSTGNIYVGTGASNMLFTTYDSVGGAYSGSFSWNSIQLGNNGTNYIVAGHNQAGGALSFVVNNTSRYAHGVTAVDGTTAIRINSNGNVGVSETDPNAKFHVTGKSNYTTANSSEVSGLGFIRLQPTSDSEHALWIHNAGNNLGISGYSDAATASTRDITLQTYGGKVGIGVASPNYPLEVTGFIATNDSSNGSGLLIRKNNATIGFIGQSGGWEGNTNSDLAIAAETGKKIIFYTDGSASQKITISTTGQLGINTTDPLGGKFHLKQGTAAFEAPGSGSAAIDGNTHALIIGPHRNRDNTANRYYGGIAFNHLLNYNNSGGYNAAAHAWVGLRLYDTPSSERSNLVFATKEGTGTGATDIPIERMTIDPFGKVGIGTTSPSEKLHVEGRLRLGTTPVITSHDDITIDIDQNNNQSDRYFRVTKDGESTELLRVQENGQVGIGVTSVPTGYKMQVAGSILASSYGNKFTIGNIDYFSRIGQYYGALQLAVWNYNNSTSTQSNTGTIQLGASGPTTYQNNVIVSNGNLTVNGSGSFTSDVVAYSSSDKRLKDNVKPIENALDKVIAIGGYEFDWNDNQEIYEGHDVGVIAQEVEEVLPEVVETRKDGYKAVKYEKMVPLLIEAIKDQQKQIEELKALLNGSTK